MARSSYKSNKRHKELARKEKQELKRQRKIDKKADKDESQPDNPQEITEGGDSA